MNDAKQNLASTVRETHTELDLSQEKLAELLNIDSHTILNIQAGRGNPYFEKLYPLIAYLKIPAGKIMDSNYEDESPNLQKLLSLQKCIRCYICIITLLFFRER
ncbi:MAG: helix-turn-helix domain-containing protein [Lachnospiraceae bacterium]|nr:helix-turn-helix domain-containing protein [Lachnospiraceae bacterium]